MSLLPLLALAALATPQDLLVTDSTNLRVMRFNGGNGDVVDLDFIDLTTVGGSPAITPIEARSAPNGEIWITDQVQDTVFRFTGDGSTWLGESTAAMNNIRGFEISGGFAWVSNGNAAGTTPARSIVQLDGNLDLVATYGVPGTPFDVLSFTWQGVDGFLITDFASHDLLFFDPANPGTLTTFHDSNGTTGINFPVFLSRRANGNVLCGGLISPSGLYEFDAATGAEVAHYGNPGGQSGAKGVHELRDGRLLFTTMNGVFRFDPVNAATDTLVAGVSSHAITMLERPDIGVAACAGVSNSTGVAAALAITGSALVSDNDATLTCTHLPANATAFFLTSETTDFVVAPGGSAGNLCLGGSIGRYVGAGQVLGSGPTGAVLLGLDLTQHPTPTGLVAVTPGETWTFQCWYRDAVGGVATSNFSAASSATFQ